ncbi:hypothetical protein IQ225_00545 [Synechocystis salina LEGE 06155]|nr:hypothetical protein [Synechocystis salina LEGE 06155]
MAFPKHVQAPGPCENFEPNLWQQNWWKRLLLEMLAEGAISSLGGMLDDLAKGASSIDGSSRNLSPKAQQLLNNIKSGIETGNTTVTKDLLNPDSLQEDNISLDFGDGKGVNLRVEVHPLKHGGPPIRHVNVETTTRNRKGRNKVTSNQHITY